MGFNLTNEYISQSFQQLVQISGSTLLNGTGSLIYPLVASASTAVSADTSISASYAATASILLGSIESASYAANADNALSASTSLSSSTSLFAITASYALNDTTDTGSFITTASVVDATITYTKGDSTVFTNTIDNVISASYAATASVLLGSVVSSSYAVSASHALNADSSISASHAVIADHSDTTDEIIVDVKNTSGIDLVKGVPVYATGVTGENINIASASNTSAATMPAIGVLGADLSNNATGTAVVSGKIIGVNTDGFTAGKNIYVNSNGDFTQTKPTGSSLIQNIGVVGKVNASDGEILIQGSGRSNDLPNITENYVWLGDSNGVPQAVASSSLLVSSANTASFLPSSTRLNITDITASNASFTSASIGYLRTTTGSAISIGDQYIILNSDSPTARFAGLKVYDSGSGLTGSFEWDSIDDNWIQVETGGKSAGMLTGISGSKGSEAYPSLNTLLKGTGNHTTQNSSIVDNGTNVTTILPISASGGITGSLDGNAKTATSASHALNADNAITASHALNSGDWNGIFTGSAKITGSLRVDGDTLLNYQTAPNYAIKEIIKFPAFTKTASPGNGVSVNYNAMLYRNIPVAGTVNNVFQIGQGFDSNFDTYGSYLNVGNSRSELALLASGSAGGLTTNQRSADIAVLDSGDSTYEGNSVARYYGTTVEIGLFNGRDIVVGNTRTGGAGFDTETLALAGIDMYLGAANGISYNWQNTDVEYTGAFQTGDIEMWYTGSVRMIQTGSATGPALTISGSVTGEPKLLSITSPLTASFDMSSANFFNITLANNADTHLSCTNVQAGQTVTVVVTNNASNPGTLSFSPNIKFAGGITPVMTATVNAIDILTFVSTDTTNVFGTSLLNFS